MPQGFWWCLAGLAAGGGLGMWMTWRLATRGGALSRLRRAWADDGASSIVEFPFAMLSLTLIILLTCQLVLMASAYVVVDYAAYAAVRAAIVVVPEDRSKDDKDEGANKVKKFDLTDGSKGSDITQAAIFVCTPISGSGLDALKGKVDEVTKKFGVLEDLSSYIPSLGDLPSLGGITGAVDRYLYSYMYTSARLVAEGKEPKEFGGSDLLTVEVTHDFALLLPVADRIFGKIKNARRVVTLKGHASMLSEGYPGEEKQPVGAKP